VAMIDPSPHRAGSAYYAVYRYLLGDFQPYIYKTDDFGKSWKRLTTGSNGIASDNPTRVVREDPDRTGLLYAGTEFGMFVSFDDGAHWQPFQLNMPVVPINDIKVFHKDLVIATQGRSFWILDNLTPLQQGGRDVADAARGNAVASMPTMDVTPGYHVYKLTTTLFKPRDAYRMRYQGGGGFGRGRGPAAPQYPQPGAMIDYSLGQSPPGSITLTVLDSVGKVVRTFTSESARRPGDSTVAGGMPGAGVAAAAETLSTRHASNAATPARR